MREEKIISEIQKRLTKSVPWLRKKLVDEVGLRFAPEVRFYPDHSIDRIIEFQKEGTKMFGKMEEASISANPTMREQYDKYVQFSKLNRLQQQSIVD
jgi:hypothetical protein